MTCALTCKPAFKGSSNDADEISIGTDDSAGDADEVKAINVENAFMDEKKAAVFALRTVCKHTGQAFMPFLYQGGANSICATMPQNCPKIIAKLAPI